MTNPNRYQHAFNGSFIAILRWPELDKLWQTLRQQQQPWWIYQPEAELPNAALQAAELDAFLTELDQQLRRDHDYDYCGIVYVDNPAEPSFIKIYDPNNLGVVCGISQGKPLPGWILSRMRPALLPAEQDDVGKIPWWRRLLGKNP